MPPVPATSSPSCSTPTGSPTATDIVLLLCQGIGTKEIAAELMISVHTVRDHLKSIFDKAGVNSRGELVAGLFSNHVLSQFHGAVVHVPS